MKPDAVDKVRKARIEADKQLFRLHLLRLEQELQEAEAAVEEPETGGCDGRG